MKETTLRSRVLVKTSAITAACAITLTLGTGASIAAAHPAPDGVGAAPAVQADNATTATDQKGAVADMEEALGILTSVPDAVLAQGDQATTEWLQENYGAGGQLQPQASVLGCTGSILAMIGGTLVPAAKIIKIKKLANELGGVTEAVKLMWGASFSYEKMQAAGGALASLGAELLGITSVKENCFE